MEPFLMDTTSISRRRFLKLAGSTVLSLTTGCTFSPASVNQTGNLFGKASSSVGDISLDIHALRQIITADSRARLTDFFRPLTAPTRKTLRRIDPDRRWRAKRVAVFYLRLRPKTKQIGRGIRL